MTPEEINMRIAEWEGWTNVKQSRMYQGRLTRWLADFLEDLWIET